MMRLPKSGLLSVLFALGLAGCARTDGVPALPAQAGAASAQSSQSAHSVRPATAFATIFSFDGANGDSPVAGLTALDGTFYGTTSNGSESVVHSFGGSDGAHPLAPLVAVNGTFYGTTRDGGANGDGTVFSLTP
jgi:uncharacterized repeat protein (TIGR03803 family)